MFRLWAFVATGLSAFAPIIHAARIFPYEQLDKQAGLRYYYLEGLLTIIGVVFYAVLTPPAPPLETVADCRSGPVPGIVEAREI